MMASLPQMAVNGRDRKNLLLAVLAIRPDHVGALKALWRLETENGDAKLANYYRSKVLEFSPLDRDASKSQIH
jgi:hypothetical protein